MLRFAPQTYDCMKEICFPVERQPEFYATSILAFKDLLSPHGFLYFCLVASRTQRCKRMFINEKTLEEIRDDPQDKLLARTIFQAHKLFGMEYNFLTKAQIDNALNYHGKGFFSDAELREFKDHPELLDFGIVEWDGKPTLLLRPVFPRQGKRVEVSFYVEDEEHKNYFDGCAKFARLEIDFLVDEILFKKYLDLRTLIDLFIGVQRIQPPRVGDLLD